MPVFTAEQLQQWSGGVWDGTPPEHVDGVGHDTRTLPAGALYIALRGENFDGHDFVPQAFEKGACAALVAQEYMLPVGAEPTGIPLLRVEDPAAALLRLATGWRSCWTGAVYGITGSVGKTTVRGMLADVLAQRGKTASSRGNWNNLTGLPLCMLEAEADAEFYVFELGMNTPGEIAQLTETLRPDHAVVTTVGRAHLEKFESEEAIAREKAALPTRIPAEGICVLAADESWFELLAQQAGGRVVTVAAAGPADYAVGRRTADRRVVVQEKDGVFEYEMPLPGEHMICNALRVIAAAREAGVAPEDVARALAAYRPPGLRWELWEHAGAHFVNDTYNANPLSMRASIQTFMREPCEGRRWLVLGGMRELGGAAEEEHLELGRFVAAANPHGLVLVGALAKQIAEGLSSGWKNTHRFYQVNENYQAAALLHKLLQPGDRVLLKASRGERLETVLTELESLANRTGTARKGGST